MLYIQVSVAIRLSTHRDTENNDKPSSGNEMFATNESPISKLALVLIKPCDSPWHRHREPNLTQLILDAFSVFVFINPWGLQESERSTTINLLTIIFPCPFTIFPRSVRIFTVRIEKPYIYVKKQDIHWSHCSIDSDTKGSRAEGSDIELGCCLTSSAP